MDDEGKREGLHQAEPVLPGAVASPAPPPCAPSSDGRAGHGGEAPASNSSTREMGDGGAGADHADNGEIEYEAQVVTSLSPVYCANTDIAYYFRGKKDEARNQLLHWMQQLQQPMHGEFVFEGSTDVHKYVFMPTGSTAAKRELVAMLQQWKLPHPNLILQTNYCCHASNQLIYQEMLDDVDAFKTFEQMTGLDSGRCTAEEHQRIVNEHLHTRLLNLWAQIASACAMTNSWILLKDSEGRGGNDFLLAQAMKSQSTKPVFMDVMGLCEEERAGFDFYTCMLPVGKVPGFVQQLSLTLDTGRQDAPKHCEGDGSSNHRGVVCLTGSDHEWAFAHKRVTHSGQGKVVSTAGWAVWDVHSSGDVPEVHSSGVPPGYRYDVAAVEHELITCAEKSDVEVTLLVHGAGTVAVCRQMAENNMKLREHARPFNAPLGEPIKIKRVPGHGHLKRKNVSAVCTEGAIKDKLCVYYTYFNPEATHHVFTIHPGDFNETALGTLGHIFSAGNSPASVKSQIQQAVSLGRPCLFLDNTGGETQQMARLIQEVVKATSEGVQVPQTLQWLDHAVTGQRRMLPKRAPQNGMRWFEPLEIQDVLQIWDRVRMHPQLFRDTIVTVDPLNDSPESILNSISKCIASVATSSDEVGAGPADKRAVYDAWHVHAQLTASASSYRASADLLAVAAICITFLATASAILDNFLQYQLELGYISDWYAGSGWEQACSLSVIILPALGGLIAAIIADGSALEKWATLHMTAAQVSSEMFMFRMRVGRYSMSSDLDEEADLDQGRCDASMRMLRARNAFSERVQSLTKNVGNVAVVRSSGTGRGTARQQSSLVRSSDGRNLMDGAALHAHVVNSLYSRRVAARLLKPEVEDYADLVEIPPPSALPGQEHVDANDVPQDTYKHVATLSNEQFFHHRVLPLLQSIESDVPRYRLRLTVLKILMMISATIATVLGAVQKPVWIPIAVSASTVFVSTLEHFKYKTRLAGATVAAAELRALVSDWEALGAVARRMGDTRKRLVRTSEGVAISLASTWTGGSFMEAVTQVPDASQDEERSP